MNMKCSNSRIQIKRTEMLEYPGLDGQDFKDLTQDLEGLQCCILYPWIESPMEGNEEE